MEALRQARTALGTIGVSALLALYVGSAVRLERGAQAMPLVEAPAPGYGGPIAPGEVGLTLDRGQASHYGMEFLGRPTASGEPYWPLLRTAAHPTLPLGSRVRVTNLDNGRSTLVRINDRGPFGHGRVIDLSHAAAREIDMLSSGSAPVELRLESAR